MADVAGLQFDAVDFDKYQDGGGATSYAPPDEGKYFGKLPIIDDTSFDKTQEDYLKLKVDPIEIVNAQNGANGYKVRFSHFSAKKYKNREGSQVLDLMRACGVAARPQNVEELKAICKSLSGRTFQFTLQWEAYNKETQETTQGQENFPVDPTNPGKRLPYIQDGDKRVWANGRLRYTISALGK